MAIGNVKVPILKAPTFKVANFRAPKVKLGVAKPKTSISVKPTRPSQIKVGTKGYGMP